MTLLSCWLSTVGVRACQGTAPPWIADQALELGGVLPIGPKGFGESGFEVIQSVENGVGEDPAQRLEPAFRRVEFGAVGRQRDLLDTIGPADLAAGVAPPFVEDEPDPIGAGMLAELLQEALEADPVDVGQEQHEAGPADRLGIQPEPMVLVVVAPRRAAAERAP